MNADKDYSCPNCQSPYKTYHEISYSNWECGCIKEGDFLYPAPLCEARREILDLKKGIKNACEYARENLQNFVETREKLEDAAKFLRKHGHDDCAEAYEIFLDKQVKK